MVKNSKKSKETAIPESKTPTPSPAAGNGDRALFRGTGRRKTRGREKRKAGQEHKIDQPRDKPKPCRRASPEPAPNARIEPAKSRSPRSKFGCAPTSSPSGGCSMASRETRRTTGWKRSGSCKKKRRNAPKEALGYAMARASGKHSFTFSRSRLIVKGLGRNPWTRASFSSSCARSSEPCPETSNNGGTLRGGEAFS